MPLRNPTDCRIARHLRDEIDIHRHHRSAMTKPRTGARRLAACVTSADDYNVILYLHYERLLVCRIGRLRRVELDRQRLLGAADFKGLPEGLIPLCDNLNADLALGKRR